MLLFADELEHLENIKHFLQKAAGCGAVTVEWHNKYTRKSGQHTGRVLFLFLPGPLILNNVHFEDGIIIPIHAITNCRRAGG